jgi:hypothetical protein
MMLAGGCFMRHAEKIVFEDGKKVEQVRTGEYAIAYWFGMKHFSIYSDPNTFYADTEGIWAKSDPNSIKAIGAASGSAVSELIP